MKNGLIPSQADRTSNIFDSNPVLAHLVSDQAKQMNRIGLIRFSGENLAIDPLGCLKPTALMMLDRSRQRTGNRCHDNNYARCNPSAAIGFNMTSRMIVGRSGYSAASPVSKSRESYWAAPRFLVHLKWETAW